MRPCEIIAVIASVLFLILSVWYASTSPVSVQPCAESCSCTQEDTNWGSAVNVQCGYRNLRSVPSAINDQPVYLLNVSFNSLKTLKEDALFNYESVRYLYLRNCKIDNISEKAFQKLENLIEIDLAYNRLNSIPPNLFNSSQKLDKLILRNNNLGSLQWNTPLLNGPSSLSFLDLQSCKLSNISSTTFSLLLNLTFLDISRNHLVLLHNDSLSSHQKLRDVNLDNNDWQCGVVFQGLICWIHSKFVPSYNRTVKCQYLNGTSDIWSPQNWSSLCNSETTRSVTSSHKPDISTSTKINLASIPSHELDISTGTKLNLASTPSDKPDISTSTKINLASIPSHELDISTGTKLNLASTPSDKPDISTSTKLNLANTPSHELDISTKKTLSSTISHTEQPGTNNAPWVLWMIFAVFFLFGVALPWLMFSAYKKCTTPGPKHEPLLQPEDNANVKDDCENTS